MIVVLLTATGAGAYLGSAVVARHRAQAVADLAALAAAARLSSGADAASTTLPATTFGCDVRFGLWYASAEHGYEGMSLRTLNAETGLSRGTINQRFHSKEQLWYAAIDHEFRHLIDDLNAELLQRMLPDDDLSRVQEGARAFLIASARRPDFVRLMNQEGLHSTSRLDYIMTSFTLPTLTPLWQALSRLADAGVVRSVPARTLLFLIAHGAAAPFTLGPLSDRFNALDAL